MNNMKIPALRLVALLCTTTALLSISLITGCSSNNVTGSNPNPLPNTYYGKNIQRIFNSSCGSGYGNCHITGSMYGVNLANYQNVMASFSSEYGKKVVIPGNPSGSPLIDKVGPNPHYGYRMPYGRAPLSTAQIDTLVQWIKNGATNK